MDTQQREIAPGAATEGARKYFVRYGAMGLLSAFTAREEFRGGDQVVVRSERGHEIGEVVCSVDNVPDSARSTGRGRPFVGRIVRRAGPDDKEKQRHIEEDRIPAEFRYCKICINEHRLPIKLTSVEHLFGGEKIIFYFLADGRVDFRALVRDLAKQYRTRIEMKQIGVRDEARLLSDHEHCGRGLCCRTFIKNLEPVTMRMAKNQKATLDPAKISGACGRLMCCLRFEDRMYDQLKRNLPKKGTRVNAPEGSAVVVDYDILSQTVVVEYNDARRDTVGADEVTPTPKRRRS